MQENLISIGDEMADLKLRELLEHPAEDNQQPNLENNFREGSETRLNDPNRIMKTHERGAFPNDLEPYTREYSNRWEIYRGVDIQELLNKMRNDDIVRTTDITKETVEPENKESQG